MRRINVPVSLAHTYRLFAPSTHNKRFRIMKRHNETGKFETIKSDKLDAINKQYAVGTLSKAAAHEQAELVKESFYKADGVKVSRVESNGANEKLVEDFIKKVVRTKRGAKPQSKLSREQALRRVARAMGEVSLLSAPIEDIQDALDSAYPDQRQRQLVEHLNAILRFAGRKDRAVKLNKEQRRVKAIPLDGIGPVIDRLPSEAWKVCAQMAVYTGCRIGELFALELHHKRPDGLFIEWQVTITGETTRPKWNKMRDTVVFPEALKLLTKWIRIRDEISLKERKRASKIIRSACKRAYPNKPQWHLCFHDLRHSFAVALLETGAEIGWVAMNIGDDAKVAKEHYIGYIQTDNMRAALARMIKESRAKKPKAG